MRVPPRSLLFVLVTALLGGALPRVEARVVMADPSFARFDARVSAPATHLPAGPPPVSGGTLLPLGGARLLVADPDRARLMVVDVDSAAITAGPSLPAGSEPARAVEDTSGRVHVVLRGAGAIVSFDPARPEQANRRSVCPMPRGIAYQAEGDLVHVACRGGELVSLPAAGGAPSRTLQLDRDLRDVVVTGRTLHVSRFRAAELLEIDASGAVSARLRPRIDEHDGTLFSAAVAWRTIGLPDGSIAMLHQRESDGEIRPSLGGYGSARMGCDGIVHPAISVFSNRAVTSGPELASAVLPVDLAVLAGPSGSSAFDRVAVALAGNQDGAEPVRVMVSLGLRDGGCIGGGPTPRTAEPMTQSIAVAYLADRRLVVQQRDPARLVVLDDQGAEVRSIALGGDPAFDTGHAIFHTTAAAQIACASCHPEGGEDGHVWRFTGVGERRTPPLHAVSGTAPFHWTGELADMRALMNEVFVLRMRGVELDAQHTGAVEGWLAHVQAPRASRGSAATIARGRALFEGPAGCAECHSGPASSDGRSHDVGSGGTFQTPSLVGVADRLPVMHTGCATTLRARFEPACGGDRHGTALDEVQLSELLAYLESL